MTTRKVCSEMKVAKSSWEISPWIGVVDVYGQAQLCQSYRQHSSWSETGTEGPGWSLNGQESGWRPQLGLGRAIKASWYPQGSGKCIKVSEVKELSLVVLSKLELRTFFQLLEQHLEARPGFYVCFHHGSVM